MTTETTMNFPTVWPPAIHSGDKMIRIDMSEYQDGGCTSKKCERRENVGDDDRLLGGADPQMQVDRCSEEFGWRTKALWLTFLNPGRVNVRE